MVTTIDEPVDPATLPLADLKAELATVAAHLYAGTCRWLELVAELDRRSGWAEAGVRSCAEWVAWQQDGLCVLPGLGANVDRHGAPAYRRLAR